jgi:exo-beta-1,3-glucanase (GH17 family)
LSVIIKYALLNPHIGFHFSVVNADGSSAISNENLAATQRLSTHTLSKRISVYSHDLNSFENLIYITADDNLILYDFLHNNFREGSNLKKDDDLLITIGQLKRIGSSKIHDIYRRLCNAMPPPGLSSKSKRNRTI